MLIKRGGNFLRLLSAIGLHAILLPLQLPDSFDKFIDLNYRILVVLLELFVQAEQLGAFFLLAELLLTPDFLILLVLGNSLVPLSAGSFQLCR